MIKCPRCEEPCSNSKQNEHRPFCSEKCKLIDFGTWANEKNIISRPAKSEDFYEDSNISKKFSIHQNQLKAWLFYISFLWFRYHL